MINIRNIRINSIRTKMVFICAAVILIVMSISGSFMLLHVRDSEIQTAREQLIRRARFVDEQIIQSFEPEEWPTELQTLLGGMPAVAQDIEQVILNAIGLPIAPWEFIREAHFHFNDQAIISAIAGEASFSIGTRSPDLNGMEQEWIAYAMPIEKDGILYIVYTRMNARPMNDHLSQLTTSIMMMVLMALVITVLLWFLFASTLSGPIVSLTRHAKEMAQGHLDKEMIVYSRDEIGQLTENFNHMAKELNTMVSALALEKNKHEAVLHNMTDGVLAYDAEGRITHANSAAGALLQFDDLDKLTLEEMLPKLGFNPEEVFALIPEQILESSLATDGRYITAYCSPYTDQEGAVDGFFIVLQDVTRHTRLDNMRREFVANVSHELRTPLASICSYTETLLNGTLQDTDTAEGFLRVVDAEAKRMSLLVTDLLELSRMDDNNPADMDREIVDLVGLTKMAVTQCLIAAQEKSQQILFSEPNKPYFIEASPGRINQVLVNIISNSIKYSPVQTKVEVTMEETDRYYRVMIRDHGMGIDKEDLPRIFERFYRVDKARSRAMGGTGLGLAIAKEIVEAHGGKITATSEPGAGTIMVLRFSKLLDA